MNFSARNKCMNLFYHPIKDIQSLAFQWSKILHTRNRSTDSFINYGEDKVVGVPKTTTIPYAWSMVMTCSGIDGFEGVLLG
jgi:hypothetical protein